ncbi:hypothetical protein F9L00_03430 [Brucella anthropi]|uniref:hypothetical protein n=1 Tax=Brucella/Ochrobactrum group TaxID=2826938 RepID=UPI00124E7D0E|nr:MULTISPECIES: hypothetical protein [Brucella/Ochrobactrum group]KAB2764797.1 hypothetical protein F9K98_01235 [Brucella anthropi]KAB2782532.1 hypothetical protein F9L00_03430 [Brucella anthropi]MCQ9143342.1 hypothetical protein [Ochrobactrum sp. BTU2]UGQ23876.1 hypothetical protein LRL11_16600 [Brucella anthropi]
MAVLSDYTDGTITVTNGSVDFTGTDTLWRSAAFREGDTVLLQGFTGVIAGTSDDDPLILSNTTGQFTEAWPGASGTFSYRMRYQPDNARFSAKSTALINLLANGILRGIADIGVEDGKLLIGNVAGLYDLIDKSELGIQDPNGSLGKLAALTLGNRQILQTDDAGALTALTLAARQILQTDANGALKAIALAANKFLRTDANGELTLSDLGAAAIALLNLSGTAEADRLPYLTGDSSANLTVLSSFARTILDDTTGAAMWATMGGLRGTASNNIYWKTPGGQLTIAGTTAGTTDANAALTAVFPVAFADANYQIVAIGGEITIPTYNVLWDRAPGACSFQVYNTGGNPRISGAARINYIAIGDA